MAPAVLLPSEKSDDVVLFMDGGMWGGSRGEDGFTVGNEELFATATLLHGNNIHTTDNI